MKICPYCMYELVTESKACPSCSYVEGSDELILQNKSWKTVLAFGVIAIFLVGGILFFDRVVLGGSLQLPSDCGGDEECLITGLAVCNVVAGKPHSYGVTDVYVRGMQSDICIVDVKTSETNTQGTDTINKRCAFAQNQLGNLDTRDLYMCQNALDAGTTHDLSVIQGAFLPLEEQIK
jgi:hypothetical protein